MIINKLKASLYQQGFWGEWKLSPQSTYHNTCMAFSIDGLLDEKALESAIYNYIERNHHAAKSYFAEQDQQLYQIFLDTLDFAIEKSNVSKKI